MICWLSPPQMIGFAGHQLISSWFESHLCKLGIAAMPTSTEPCQWHTESSSQDPWQQLRHPSRGFFELILDVWQKGKMVKFIGSHKSRTFDINADCLPVKYQAKSFWTKSVGLFLSSGSMLNFQSVKHIQTSVWKAYRHDASLKPKWIYVSLWRLDSRPWWKKYISHCRFFEAWKNQFLCVIWSTQG